MRRITGAWERLPNHGVKPAVVIKAEQLEQDLENAQNAVRVLQKKYKHAKQESVKCIANLWDAKDAARTLFDSHFWIADELAKIAHPDGRDDSLMLLINKREKL